MRARAQDSAVMEDRGMNIPGLKEEDRLCPDGRGKIFSLEQESWEQEISCESELYSADNGGRL